jgi:hypothetical protein
VLSQSDERVRIELHGNYASSGRFERAARKFDVELVRVAERPRYGYVDVEGPG